MPAPYDRASILGSLRAGQSDGEQLFSTWDFVYGASQINALRSNTEWLICFQKLSFAMNVGCFSLAVYAHGNKLPRSPFFEVLTPIAWPDGSHLEGRWPFDMFEFEVLCHGRPLSVSATASDYRAARVPARSNMPKSAKVLRLLVHLARDRMFLPPQELLKSVGRPGSDAAPFLTLDHFFQNQDGLRGTKADECETYQMLAAAICANDPALYRPTIAPNSDWWLWEDLITPGEDL